MPKICDGFEVGRWSEFDALLRYFGCLDRFDAEKPAGCSFILPEVDRLCSVVFHFPVPVESNDYIVTDKTSWEAYRSPEFVNFCRRFGIPLELHTTFVMIRLCEGECPEVTHRYQGYQPDDFVADDLPIKKRLVWRMVIPDNSFTVYPSIYEKER